MDQNNLSSFKNPKFILKLLGMLLLAGIIIVSIIRDRIVNYPQYQVSVNGQGKVAYNADIAVITLGVQVDKVKTAEDALKQLNDKMNKIIEALKKSGVKDENIQTENYSLSPQYDVIGGISKVSGYSANQQLTVKVVGIDEDQNLIGNTVKAAGAAGSNQITGVKFDVSNLNDLKQEARIKAIADAKSKSDNIARAAGVKLKRVIGWYENIIKAPDTTFPYYGYGLGGGGEGGGGLPTPQIPSGSQEIIIEINLNYEVK